ncbi:hypothetical protein CGC48_05565 [Capnocytophaga cynodegmi]|uniref:Carbamoyltransferase n=1 Tax=Capnocytophaga cynodegmi TaxID=28189 RepID=A0A250E5F2_9FLAO|nr:carbamoyltransferase C-terminal domain-containing protein [Capnocytophaga cynodegmi]ATA68144.1 hypothetical protein CGC48_05565 [Capnocytophaga cynodegmi]
MSKPTLAIYGIKDRNDFMYPEFTHDHNLCLMQNGKILQYLQLERLTRRKYDNRLDLFLEDLIENKQIDLPDEFDFVSINSFVGNAFISKNGRFRFESSIETDLSTDLQKGFFTYQHNLRGSKEINAYNCPHELAHIFSCLPFFGKFKENSLLISLDGGSSLGNFSAFHYKTGKMNLIECHWELGYLSKFFNDNALSFQILGAKPSEHCSVPGKLMGYASFGNYDLKIENWLKEHHYFRTTWNNQEVIFNSIEKTFGIKIDNFDTKNPFFQNVAATFQYIFERDIILKIRNLQNKTQAEYLYYSGGCALNIVTNSKIVENHFFKDVFIPPCCNDSGLSVGAATFLEWKKGNEIHLHSPYLNNVGIRSSKNKITQKTIEQTAEIIMQKGVIAVCNDNAEVGPRALGNRSMLALANDKEIAQKLSVDIKKREWYRPVAPIMLEKVFQKVTTQKMNHLAKYMLLDFTIKKDFENDLCGVTHVNKTARIQVISKQEDNPFIFKLLSYLYEKYNVLALINTSFNTQGEPIVHTSENALQSAKQMKLQAVVINNTLHKL